MLLAAAPILSRMVRLFPSRFAVTRSGCPLPSKSPMTIWEGEVPVARLLAALKLGATCTGAGAMVPVSRTKIEKRARGELLPLVRGPWVRPSAGLLGMDVQQAE